MAEALRQTESDGERTSLLFVDDEERVLNSMRIMFRRRYDLHTASDGSEALRIIREREIDVIVADHRMPQMTGVEVLTAVRHLSPRTVRILLTGYADLDAVERSINEGEVFRFLTKPCAPQQLRDTIEMASKLARDDAAVPRAETELEYPLSGESPAAPFAAADNDNDNDNDNEAESIEIVLESDRVTELRPTSDHVDATADDTPSFTATAVIPRTVGESAVAGGPPRRQLAQGLGIIVFSADDEVTNTIQQAVRGRVPVYRATNVVQVVRHLNEHRPGVLLTDISVDRTTIQAMTARLKQHLPELVTVAVSEHRDVMDMVWLINHGQIFRFLRKPLSPGRCAVSLQAALQYHRALLRNPSLARRHEVDSSEASGLVDGLLTKLRNVKRLWASV